MNRTVSPRSTPGHTRVRWALLVVLGLAVFAMGVLLTLNQSQPATASSVVWSGTAQNTPALSSSGAPNPATDSVPADSQSPIQPTPVFEAVNRPLAQINQTLKATNNIASAEFQPSSSPRPVQPRLPEPAVARPSAAGP